MVSLNNFLYFAILIELSFDFINCIKVYKSSESTHNANNEDLLLVHVLFRHGNRTADFKEIYPKDPHMNETFVPYGYGQLTNTGREWEYKLGKELRERYRYFLGDVNNDLLEARSSDYGRTKMSLEFVLAGLLSKRSEGIEDIDPRQYYIYNYTNVDEDYMFLASDNCPKFMQLYTQALKSKEAEEVTEACKSIYEFLSNHTGWKIIDQGKAWKLYFSLEAEEEFGLHLPNWTKLLYPNPLKYFAIYQYYLMTSTIELKRILSGFLLKFIIDETVLKINHGYNENRKLYLYSGHEINIASLLSTLGIFHPHIPDYGSYVAIEVYRTNENGYGIKILNQNYEEDELTYQKIPGCDFNQICPLDKFISIVNPYLLDINNTDHC